MKEPDIVFEVENCCVSCGEWIPEGRQVCPNCENKVKDNHEEK